MLLRLLNIVLSRNTIEMWLVFAIRLCFVKFSCANIVMVMAISLFCFNFNAVVFHSDGCASRGNSYVFSGTCIPGLGMIGAELLSNTDP